jgi:hypothetical protein
MSADPLISFSSKASTYVSNPLLSIHFFTSLTDQSRSAFTLVLEAAAAELVEVVDTADEEEGVAGEREDEDVELVEDTSGAGENEEGDEMLGSEEERGVEGCLVSEEVEEEEGRFLEEGGRARDLMLERKSGWGVST